MPDNQKFNIGDIVIADYPHARIPIRGRIKEIHDDTYVDIVVNKHGYGKITVSIDRLYHNHAEYNTAMDEKAAADFKNAYEQTATVNGLLRFLSGREMLCRGDATAAQWKAILKRLDEARVESLKGCVFD